MQPAEPAAGLRDEPVMTAGSYNRHAHMQAVAMQQALAYIREAAQVLTLPAAGVPLRVGGPTHLGLHARMVWISAVC